MSEITNIKEFKQVIDSLPINQQRLVASKFIADILDLTDDDQLIHAQTVAANPNATEDDYLSSYKYSKHVAVKAGQYEWEEVDYLQQIRHFVANACAVCLAPSDSSVRGHHLAWNVAHYCNCARTCASIAQDEKHPNLANADKLLKEQINNQFQIVNNFLASH